MLTHERRYSSWAVRVWVNALGGLLLAAGIALVVWYHEAVNSTHNWAVTFASNPHNMQDPLDPILPPSSHWGSPHHWQLWSGVAALAVGVFIVVVGNLANRQAVKLGELPER